MTLRYFGNVMKRNSLVSSEALDPRRWWTLAVLCLSLLVIGLDNTILNVALPTLQRDLDASSSQLQWIVDVYMLLFAGVLLTAGSLGDRFGRKRALTLGLVVFGLGSLGSALATSPELLIAMRGVMGIGGAFIMPSTLSILTATFPAHERGKAIGIWAGVSGLGIAIGPVAGGWLIENADWSWIFLVNLPVVVVALIAGRFLVPESRDESAPRLDLGGFGLSFVALTALVWGLIEAPSRGWTDALVLAAFAFSALTLVGVHRLGAPHTVADARHRAVPQPALQRLERRDLTRVLRPVRRDLPAHPVPAGGARLLGAGGRPADDAGRGRARVRRAAVGEADRAARDPGRRARRPDDRGRCAVPAHVRRRDVVLLADRDLARSPSASAWRTRWRRPPTRSWARCRRRR